MTTVIFYKGVMACDSLQTSREVVMNKVGEIIGFSLVDKMCYIEDSDLNKHLLGGSGHVDAIEDFIANYTNLKKYKPIGDFSIFDWDGEILIGWQTAPRYRFCNTLLNLFSFSVWDLPEWTNKLQRIDLKFDNDDNTLYALGTGARYVEPLFDKMKFLFKRKLENISDHLTPKEVLAYLIKATSLLDTFTNDKIIFKTLTPVSPQNANLSKG